MAKVMKKKEEKPVEVPVKKTQEFVTTKDIAVTVSETCGIPLVQAQEVCNTMVDTIIGSVQEGYGVYLHGLGRIISKDMPERQGRNPRTGETVTIAAKAKLIFKFSPSIKKVINE